MNLELNRGQRTYQQGKGQRSCVSRIKGSEGNGKGKGFRNRTEREKCRSGTERVKSVEEPGTGSKALGKGYRTHGCHESQDVW